MYDKDLINKRLKNRHKCVSQMDGRYWGKRVKLNSGKNHFSTTKMVFGHPKNPKRFIRISSNAINLTTRGLRRRVKTVYIEWVFPVHIFNPTFFIAVGSSSGRSTTKVHHASWRVWVIFLASFSSRTGSVDCGRTTCSRVIHLANPKTFHCGLYFLIESA